MKNEIPHTVYRYRPMIKSHDDEAIRDGYLYCSDPKDFNDPFEFQAIDSVKIPRPTENWNAFTKINNSIFNLSDLQVWEGIRDGSLNEILHHKEVEWKRLLDEKGHELVQGVACCCLSRNPAQPLMWGHYSNGLRGLTIGFDTLQLSRSIGGKMEDVLRPVVYSTNNTIPFIDYANIMTETEGSDEYRIAEYDLFVKRFCTKSSHWQYEDEIRILRYPVNSGDKKKLHYNSEAVKEVIFGELMEEKKRLEIKSFFDGQEVKFKEAVRSDTHYEICIRDL